MCQLSYYLAESSVTRRRPNHHNCILLLVVTAELIGIGTLKEVLFEFSLVLDQHLVGALEDLLDFSDSKGTSGYIVCFVQRVYHCHGVCQHLTYYYRLDLKIFYEESLRNEVTRVEIEYLS